MVPFIIQRKDSKFSLPFCKMHIKRNYFLSDLSCDKPCGKLALGENCTVSRLSVTSQILWLCRLVTVLYFAVRSYMSIAEFYGPPSWPLDASKTGESTKCHWVGVAELITGFVLPTVSLASRD